MHRRTRLRITIPFREGLTTTPGKERRDDALTSTDAGGYATAGVLRKNPGVLCGGGAPARGALSPEPGPPDRGGSAPVFPVSGQREESRARHGHDRVVRDSVLLRADAPSGVDDAPIRASRPRAQVAGGVESGGGPPRARDSADSGVPRVSDDHLCLRTPVARRGAPAGRRCRQRADGGACPRQRQTGSLRSAPGPTPAGAARALADPSP